MRSLWLKLRLPLAIFCVLVMTLVLARLFSGPEDTWIRNERGEWVKHGNPSGPPPAQDYREPKSHLILPLVIVAGFVFPLFFFGCHKPQNRLTYEITRRDMRVMGYLRLALPLLGVLLLVGLAIEIGFAESDTSIPVQEMLFNTFFIFSLAGFSGLCILLGVVFYMMKRTINDHYHLERSCRELIEELHDRFPSAQ